MIQAALSAKLEMIFGNVCTVPEAHGAQNMVEIMVNADIFEKLLHRWRELPPATLPRLRGLSVTRSRDTQLRLILDAGGREPFLLLSIKWPTGRAAPSLASIWPYASWWEDELRSLEKFAIENAGGKARITWQPN